MQIPIDLEYSRLAHSFSISEINKLLLDLTSQERKILQLTGLDFSCKEIADQLNISAETVKKHRKNILKKLQLSGKVQFRRLLRHLYSTQPVTQPNNYPQITPNLPLNYPIGGIDCL